MDLSSNVQELRKMMTGIGCNLESQPETEIPEDIGGLQTLFDVDQGKKMASYVHQGSVWSFMHNTSLLEYSVINIF